MCQVGLTRFQTDAQAPPSVPYSDAQSLDHSARRKLVGACAVSYLRKAAVYTSRRRQLRSRSTREVRTWGGWSRYVRIRYRTDTRCTFRGKESDRVNSRLAIVATFIGELRGGSIYKFSDLPTAGITQPLDESVGTDLVARPSVKFRTCLVLRSMATKQQ